jgi:hypothetical protein
MTASFYGSFFMDIDTTILIAVFEAARDEVVIPAYQYIINHPKLSVGFLSSITVGIAATIGYVKLGYADKPELAQPVLYQLDAHQKQAYDLLGKDSNPTLQRVRMEHGGKLLELFELPNAAGYAAIMEHPDKSRLKSIIHATSAEAIASAIWPDASYPAELANRHLQVIDTRVTGDALSMGDWVEQELLRVAQRAAQQNPYQALLKTGSDTYVSRLLTAHVVGDKIQGRFADETMGAKTLSLRADMQNLHTKISSADADTQIATDFMTIFDDERQQIAEETLGKKLKATKFRSALMGRTLLNRLSTRIKNMGVDDVGKFAISLPRITRVFGALNFLVLPYIMKKRGILPTREGIRSAWGQPLMRQYRSNGEYSSIISSDMLRDRIKKRSTIISLSPENGKADDFGTTKSTIKYNPDKACLSRLIKTGYRSLIDGTGHNADAGEGLIRIYDPSSGLVCVRAAGKSDGVAFVFKASEKTSPINPNHPLAEVLKGLGNDYALRIEHGVCTQIPMQVIRGDNGKINLEQLRLPPRPTAAVVIPVPSPPRQT